MKRLLPLSLLALLHSFLCVSVAQAQFPDDFKDPVTGARIIRLSTLPGDSPATVIYFTQPCITPDSRYALVRYLIPEAGHTAGTMYRYDFKTGQLVKLTDQVTRNQWMVPASGNLYYTSADQRAIYVTDIRTLQTRKVADMPAGTDMTSGVTVNADETTLVGTGAFTTSSDKKESVSDALAPNHSPVFAETFEKHAANMLFSVDIRTGKVTELQRINTWLGHPQFSPVDPTLFLYCHEGPWASVDRMWTMHLGQPVPSLVLKRTETNEIAGHEFWSTDGSTVWYDHDFRADKSGARHWLEGKNLKTGVVTRYPIRPPFGSIHYTQSPDGKFFVCDGGANKADPSRQGMFILVPEAGVLHPIRLCSMEKNNYHDAEPNPHLTPDQHWVIFTATFTGVSQAYAVEMPRQFWK